MTNQTPAANPTDDGSSSLGHMPTGEKWEFDDSVAQVFDDMLERSIPEYAVMRRAVTDLAIGYGVPGTDILDMGCSRGEAMAELIVRLGAQNRFVGIEVSQPMIESCRDRFAGLIQAGILSIMRKDLRHEFPKVRASVVLSVLTLMFVPLEYRQRVIRDVYRSLVSGGAFIVVEKVLGADAEINEQMVDLYYANKKRNGYSQEEIDRKRFSLEGVLVPMTARWNEEMLHDAGFRRVDCFWRWMNFCGWLAVKD